MAALTLQWQLSCCDRAIWGFPGGTSPEEPTCQCRRPKRHRLDPWVGKIPCRRAQQPTPGLLPGGPHGRSLVGYSPRAHRVRQDWSSLTHTQAKQAENIYHQALHTQKYSLTTTTEEIREASKNGCISSLGCRAIQGAWNRDQETRVQVPGPWPWTMH